MPLAARSRPTGIPHRAAVVLGSLAVGFVLLLLVAHRTSAATPDECQDLQRLIDATPSGGTLEVPACIYRQSVTIDRPMHLIAEPGTTIVGTDLWTEWDGRTSVERVPEFVEHGECEADRHGCARPDRVILDGTFLERVDREPGVGEYRLDVERRVVLGEEPAGREVEVVVRTDWIRVASSDVTIEGFAMRHAANPAQTGAVEIGPGVARVTLRRCDAGYAAGGVLSIRDSSEVVIEGCMVHHGGQLGIHISGGEDTSRGNAVRDTVIRDNNMAGFDPEWEAGGLKATRQSGLVLEGNTAHDNRGPGLWCDIDCVDIEIVDNTVHDNTHAGIFFEISDGALIADNRVWRNGWGKSSWGWGAGILVSSASNAEVRANTVAWNAAGITVISQDRHDGPAAVTGVQVVDNLVVGDSGRILVGWLQDWDGALFDPAGGNLGRSNDYWMPDGGADAAIFGWAGDIRGLQAFLATPGEEGARFLAAEEANALLAEAGIPPSVAVAPPPVEPPVEPPAQPPAVTPGTERPWGLPPVAILGVLVVAVLLILGGSVLVLRHRSGASHTTGDTERPPAQ